MCSRNESIPLEEIAMKVWQVAIVKTSGITMAEW
jgi:hypothetical protein